MNPGLTAVQIATIANNLPVVNTFGPPPVQAIDDTLVVNFQTFFCPFTISFPNLNAFNALNPHQVAIVTLTASLTVQIPTGPNNATTPFTLTAQANIELAKGEDPYLVNLNPTSPQAFPVLAQFRPQAVQGYRQSGASDVQRRQSDDRGPVVRQRPDRLYSGRPQSPEQSQPDHQWRHVRQRAGAGRGFVGARVSAYDNAGQPVFNFAVARVRLTSGITTTVGPVRVFFRLLNAASTNSTFTEVGTGDGNLPMGHERNRRTQDRSSRRRTAPEFVAVPCFATERVNLNQPADMKTQTDPPNAQMITTVPGQEVDTYFGCWLDVNQTTPFMILDSSVPSVRMGRAVDRNANRSAARSPSPRTSVSSPRSGLTTRPFRMARPHRLRTNSRNETSPGWTAHNDGASFRHQGVRFGEPARRTDDHLGKHAQGKRRIDLSACCGFRRHHRAGEFDVRTSSSQRDRRAHRPVPERQCDVGSGAAGPGPVCGPAFGGFALDGSTRPLLYDRRSPADAGQRRRLGRPPPPIQIAERRTPEIAVPPKPFSWRQVLGAFQYTITVKPAGELLYPQERLLAWLKWRIGVTPSSSRWLPVLQRYLSLTEGLVTTLGGDPSKIPPSQTGAVPGKGPSPPRRMANTRQPARSWRSTTIASATSAASRSCRSMDESGISTRANPGSKRWCTGRGSSEASSACSPRNTIAIGPRGWSCDGRIRSLSG